MDKIKPEFRPNSAQLYNIFQCRLSTIRPLYTCIQAISIALITTLTIYQGYEKKIHEYMFSKRSKAYRIVYSFYLRENIHSPLLRSKYIGHARLTRNILTGL